MAEEVKKEEKKTETNKGAATFLKYVLGIVFIVLGLALILKWWSPLLTLIKGCIGPFLILAGIITLAIAKE